jgi:hypothetical protein
LTTFARAAASPPDKSVLILALAPRAARSPHA